MGGISVMVAEMLSIGHTIVLVRERHPLARAYFQTVLISQPGVANVQS